MGVGERKRVAVLMGGVSSEHDVSICTGLNVLDALDPKLFEGVPVYLRRDGDWSFGVRPAMPSLGSDAAPIPFEPAALPHNRAVETGVLERLTERFRRFARSPGYRSRAPAFWRPPWPWTSL
jgi:hypothetical protein